MISIVIQAGGQSSRMGRDKGLVLLNQKPMVEHVLARVADLGDEVLLTTNAPDDYAFLNLHMASDEHPGAGALEGLRTALHAAHHDTVLIVACDLPFVNTTLLKYLLSLASQADVIVPRWDDRFQPLQAVYRRNTCLQAVEAALAQGKQRMNSFYDAIQVLTIPEGKVAEFSPDGLSFFNVNTPEELARAEQLIKDQQ